MKVAAAFLVIMALSTVLLAQDKPNLKVFGGYSLERIAPCGPDSVGCKAEGGPVPTTNFNGWNVSVTGYFHNSLGITADFSGHYAGTNQHGLNLVNHRYSYLFGPVYEFRGRTTTPFIHALFGGVSQSGAFSNYDYNEFMFALGGGVDVALARHFAIRAAQLDYERSKVPSFGSGTSANGFRYSGGVVVKF